MAIWLQYKKRNTFRARMFLCAGALIVVLINLGEPFLLHGERSYRLPTKGTYPTFHVDTYRDQEESEAGVPAKPAQRKPAPVNDDPPKDEDVEIQIPIINSGLANGTFAQVRGFLLSLQAPDGSMWSSDWESSYRFLLPGESRTVETFKMEYKTYNRLKSVSLTARVSEAVEIFRDQDSRIVTATDHQFAVPGVGRCWIDAKSDREIHCHSPLIKPPQLLVRFNPADSTCTTDDDSDDDSADAPTTPIFAWESNGDSSPAEFGFSPVESMNLYFSEYYGSGRQTAKICPGTPLTFSFPTLAERSRGEFEIYGLKLADYRKHPFKVGREIYIEPRSKTK